MKFLQFIFCLIMVTPINFLYAQDQDQRVFKVYLDADFSSHYESSQSMYMGLKVALEQMKEQRPDFAYEILLKDHHGNSLRSKKHIDAFINDPDGLFILGGLHSPPYIQFRDYINENEALLLVAWAAGGPITRYDKGDNWIFRLSLDDTKVGGYLSSYAINEVGCKAPHLLLESTPWGKSNNTNMSKAIHAQLGSTPAVTWFNWNTKINTAKQILRNIKTEGSDCILFVGNAIEGYEFVYAMSTLSDQYKLPIFSHWGITGGDFHEKLTNQIRNSIDLQFVQPCFSFSSSDTAPLSQDVLQRAHRLFPSDVTTATDIKAPPGFVHAHDIGLIVTEALKGIDLTGDIKTIRLALKYALENLDQDVMGLLKTYQTPFEEWSSENPDAHEALDINDYCMAYYGAKSEIIIIPNGVSKNNN